MDKLKKIGLTALAGTFAATSVQALEMSASGSAGFTYSSKDSDEVTGERFSFGDSITLSGSGETDMGWTVTASYELDDGATPFDDQTIAIDTGNGTFKIQTAASSGGHHDLVPNAYGSASYSLSNGVGTETSKHVADGGTGTTDISYHNADIAAGVGLVINLSPGATGGTDAVIKLKKADIIDGLTVALSRGDINPSDSTNEQEELTLSASYAIGGLTLGYTQYSTDYAAAGSGDTEATHIGASFAINDDLSVSIDRSVSDRDTQSVDEETTSYQVAYTMGSMSIKAHLTKADNVGYASTATDENKALKVGFSF